MEKILKLAEKSDKDVLMKYLDTLSEKELSLVLKKAIITSEDVASRVFRVLLQGSPCTSDPRIKRTLWLYKEAVGLIQSGDLTPKLITEWIGQLLMQADSLPPSGLLELSTMMIELMKSREGQCRRWLELLPKIITAIGAKDVVVFAGSEMAGSRCKGHVVNSLCSSKWNAEDVIHLAAMFRDIPLSNDELRFVVEKLLRMLKDIELQEIPPLVYQLLLLSTKGNKRQVLEGIISFFNAEEEKWKMEQRPAEDSELEVESHSKEEVYHTEGTVILHFTFAMKQDQDLAREFIKFLKTGQQTPRKILTPFTIALGLSVGRANRFEEPIFDSFKIALSKTFKEIDYHKNSMWFREIIPSIVDIDVIFTDAVKNSTYDWDYVTQGFVELGFALMESTKKSVGRKASDTAKTDTSCAYSPACSLGMKILLKTFKTSDIVRSDILERILNQVITRATAPAAHYLDLLAQIVKASPVFVLDSVGKIQQVLDYLALLRVGTAESFMKALQPLLRINMALKDSLMIVLRKAMFSRHLESRKIAVTGFLLFLKYFKVLGGLPASQQTSQSSFCSQVFAEIHTTINSNANEALCLELLGTLRRSLTQQSDVRVLVYEGLTKVMNENSKLRSCILNMLLSQLKPYYEPKKDVSPPLKLEPTIMVQGEEILLQEPLAHLIQCIQQCLHQSKKLSEISNSSDSEESDAFEDSRTTLVGVMKSLTQRMVSSELEDFELDKSADYNTTTSVGNKNNTFANLVLGVYEVLMDYCLSEGDDIRDSAVDQVLALFQNYRKLSSILKDKGTSGTGGKKNGEKSKKAGRPSLSKLLPRSLLSFNTAARVLTYLLSDNADRQELLAPLCENEDFVLYIVGVVTQKVQQVKDQGKCDDPAGSDADKIFIHLCQVAKVNFYFYNREATDVSSQTSSKTAHLPSVCLDTFCSIVSVVSSRYSERLGEFLASLDDFKPVSALSEPGKNSTRSSSTSENIQDNDRIWMHIRKLQRCVTAILDETEEDNPRVKHVFPLINIITLLSSRLVSGSQQFNSTLTWVQKLCTEQKIDDAVTVKALLTLYFNLLIQAKGIGSVMSHIAQDIHCRMGDIDEDVEVEETKHYAIITAKNGPMIAQLLMQQIDQSFVHVDWVLSIMKADLALLPARNDDEQVANTDFEQKEKKVCSFLGTTITVIHELVQTALPVGACIESLLKLLNHLYTTIALLVKYYVAAFTQGVVNLCPRFEKLVKLSATHLTPQVYALITYIQASQTEQLSSTDKKKKRYDYVLEKAKVLRETRLIPTLIFGIEEYEKFLIQLTKKSKVNLMENMKLSTSRDFRINMAAVQSVLSQQSSIGDETTVASDKEQVDDGNDDEEENQPPDEPPPKRAKTVKPPTARRGRAK